MDTKTKEVIISEHTYAILLHPAEEGWPLAAEIASLAAEPFARVIDAWLKTSKDLEDGLDFTEVLKGLDWGQVGKDVAEALRLLAKRPDLLKKLFSHTTRNGKPLSHPLNFDEAFRGNYKEMGQALFEVVKANGFLPFSF